MADEKYVSGEEYNKLHEASSRSSKRVTLPVSTIALVIAAMVLCGVGFAGGVAYQKHKTKPAGQTSTVASGFTGRSGGARRGGNIGQVTAVSDTSISVINQRTNASTAYAINSSTAISDNSQTVAASDIKTGDTVLITTSTSDTKTATRILVNPSFGGGGQQGQGTSANDDTGQAD